MWAKEQRGRREEEQRWEQRGRREEEQRCGDRGREEEQMCGDRGREGGIGARGMGVWEKGVVVVDLLRLVEDEVAIAHTLREPPALLPRSIRALREEGVGGEVHDVLLA